MVAWKSVSSATTPISSYSRILSHLINFFRSVLRWFLSLETSNENGFFWLSILSRIVFYFENHLFRVACIECIHSSQDLQRLFSFVYLQQKTWTFRQITEYPKNDEVNQTRYDNVESPRCEFQCVNVNTPVHWNQNDCHYGYIQKCGRHKYWRERCGSGSGCFRMKFTHIRKCRCLDTRHTENTQQ